VSVGRVMDSRLTQTPMRDAAAAPPAVRPVPSPSPAAHAVGKENASSNSAAPTQAMYSEEVSHPCLSTHPRGESATKTVLDQCSRLGKFQSPPGP
jgi:hypothetical protein